MWATHVFSYGKSFLADAILWADRTSSERRQFVLRSLAPSFFWRGVMERMVMHR